MSNATLQQRAAIEVRGNALLVAGAGTGKTTTLVNRCLRLILEEHVAIDRILMVTFTEAAAAEMRHRIRAALQKKLAENPDDLRLAEQLALLDTAFISTLHAFCLRLVREHFHELQIDPQLTVLDEQQTRPLAEMVLEDLFQRAYADTSPHGEQVRELIERYGRGDDKGIRKLVWQLHVFMQSLARPQAWLTHTLAFYAGEQSDLWHTALLAGAKDWADEWQGIVAETARDAANLLAIRTALDGFLLIPSLERLAGALSTIASSDQKESWKYGTKKFRKPLEAFFDDANFLRTQLPKDPADPVTADWQQVRDPMCALLKLTQAFSEAYRLAKRDMGGVDFSDLEQLSLQLLLNDKGQPTATARLWQQRFDHIFVDECQDINAAQDALIGSVSRSDAQANRFMVGDVKQSIYRFRLANPHIFQTYEQQWKIAGEHHQVLPLTENFRSREGVIDAVNALFGFLMRPDLGGLRYDAEAALQFGAPEARAAFSRAGSAATPVSGVWPEPALRTELHLVVMEKDAAEADDEWADLLTAEREARIVAKRLRELHDGQHQVWDKEAEEFRAVRWSDMAILLRSAAGKAESFVRACHEAGVPLLAERAGFFTAIEVLDLINLLRLLDNPLQDIPLLAVLRSPLVGLSLDELAFTRASRKQDCCWLALHQWHREHRDNADTLDTWRLVDDFFRHHTAWRAL
ncbi:MAG: ATP-dependent deoxyribonuclease subunit, partial [Verrucomicrobia bacterium]|nr:ATP-dependent deoxyribonuclease subunit [Verrucomicrobiota bacterium]